MIKHVVRFADYADYSVLKGRAVIYLDMNIWIDLADEKSVIAKDLKQLLQFLVKEKKIFCPLHFPVLSELYAHTAESMTVVGELMNELSLNFSFAPRNEIWEQEVRVHAYSVIEDMDYSIPMEELLVPYAGYLSSYGTLTYQDGQDKDAAKKMTEEIMKQCVREFTLPRIVSTSKAFKDRNIEGLSEKLNNEWKAIYNNSNGDRARIEIQIENSVAKNFILPVIYKINSTLSPTNLVKLTEHFKSMPRDSKGRAFKHLVRNAPSLRNHCELFSIALLDNGKNYTQNDFYDLEHMIIPLAYSDVFVSRDGWIRHLLKLSDLANRNSCTYLYDIKDLMRHLGERFLKTS